jgi:hypothetical protein
MSVHTEQIRTWRSQAALQLELSERWKTAGDADKAATHLMLSRMANEAADRLEALEGN